MPINEWSESILIVELSDEPQLSEDLEGLMRRLEEAPGELPDVVIDAQAVSYLNSSNIAQFLKLRKRLIDSNVRLRLCGLNDHVWSVMLVTGLDKVFEFTDDVSTSLASLMIGGE